MGISKNFVAGLMVAATTGFLSTGVQAAAITASSANVQIISLPTDVSGGDPNGALESDSFFRVFEENTTTVSGLAVNTVTVGETIGTATGGTVSGQVTSFFVHFDPIGNVDLPVGLLGGSLTFDGPILGIIWDRVALTNTDATLGLSGTTYTPAAFRGYESADTLNFTSANAIDFATVVDAKKVDSFRVLVGTQIPEPGMLAIFGLGLAGLGYARRKRAA